MPPGTKSATDSMNDSDGSVSGSSARSGKTGNSGGSFHNDDGSNSGGSAANTSVGNSSNRLSKLTHEEALARQEDRAVAYSKTLVLVVLLVSAAVAGALTWIFSERAEDADFRTQFDNFALEISDVSRSNVANVFGLIDGFSLSVTSFTLSSESTWPTVTVPHFEVRGGQFLNLSKSLLLSFGPLVTDLDQWNSYSVESQDWLEDSYLLRGDADTPDRIQDQVYRVAQDGTRVPASGNDQYLPLWQQARAPGDTSQINFDLLSNEIFAKVFAISKRYGKAVLSEVFDPSDLLGVAALLKTEDNTVHPESILVQPVFDSFAKETRSVVGAAVSVLPWEIYFSNLLHEGAKDMVCVVRSTCGDVFSYRISGPRAKFVGFGDHHDDRYDDDLEFETPFTPTLGNGALDEDGDHCDYALHIYPTRRLEDGFHTNKPAIFTAVVVLVFFFTSMVFLAYDLLVQRRQEKVHTAAAKSNAIVSSLFPAEIRDRLFQQNDQDIEQLGAKHRSKQGGAENGASKFRLKSYLDSGEDASVDVDDNGLSMDVYDTKPIADLFLNTTVLFADIAGFTAWSSVREPSQVFTLLETVYRAFDAIAKRRRVFKVETIGDCYVAVTGLPEARKDHAIVMCRFARDCVDKFNELSKKLEVSLGPDTGDLAVRVGLHSGPVTAGVLRGDKSRFQLFGDTVNTAARVESTGMRNRIHMSEETAKQLMDQGRESWCLARSDTVHAKGKGELTTFWLTYKESAANSSSAGTPQDQGKNDPGSVRHAASLPPTMEESFVPDKSTLSPKMIRLVDWNVDVLKRLLKLIIAKRNAGAGQLATKDSLVRLEESICGRDGMVLDEVLDIVTLPKFDAKAENNQADPKTIELPPKVVDQLREYIRVLATNYRETPFHNFEHASHVTMSVSKLLSRIVAPDIDEADGDVASSLHDHTYGITSDPLTQFSVVLAALIHDVDHVGLPNYLLIEENPALAATYKNKCVAEQNSIDLAWQVLMESRFSELRTCIYGNATELRRFRQLLVNTVLATDIFDKELNAQRKSRWAKAFDEGRRTSDKQEDINRKATIVIEHLVLASDVAHTMQHWHIYQKWNERLFSEMFNAFKTGRSTKDPSEGWYKGELGFFDNYIIPLAKKLRDCQVFGVSSDEYLNYAVENRREWAAKGEEVVTKMIEKYNPKVEEPMPESAPDNKMRASAPL